LKLKPNLKHLYIIFFFQYVRDTFPDTSYVFDVYIDKKRKVYILDFNPFGEVTDALLYTWDELLNLQSANNFTLESFEFLIIENAQGIRPGLAMSSRLPKDMIDLSNTLAIENFVNLMKDGDFDKTV